MQSYLAKVQVASGHILAGTILDRVIKDRWVRRETCATAHPLKQL
jgi:hypothetical protein